MAAIAAEWLKNKYAEQGGYRQVRLPASTFASCTRAVRPAQTVVLNSSVLSYLDSACSTLERPLTCSADGSAAVALLDAAKQIGVSCSYPDLTADQRSQPSAAIRPPAACMTAGKTNQQKPWLIQSAMAFSHPVIK